MAERKNLNELLGQLNTHWGVPIQTHTGRHHDQGSGLCKVLSLVGERDQRAWLRMNTAGVLIQRFFETGTSELISKGWAVEVN